MAADVAKFSAAIDKVHKTFSTQDVQFDVMEMKGLSNRGTKQYMEQKFQQQLHRARAAFLQEFRNHCVVVETEVRKIREELTQRFEEQYGERISQLKAEAEGATTLVQKHREEIAKLKSQVQSHESYIAEVRPRLEVEEKLRSEIVCLKDELDTTKQGSSDLGLQLKRRDELVSHLTNEIKGLQGQLKRQAATSAEERRIHEDHIQGLQQEMLQQQEQFKVHLETYEATFEEYRAKTTKELQIQEVLNKRRSEALAEMDQERQRHIKARTKPTLRIGPAGETEEEIEARCIDYEVADDARYRTDDMGMDTGWRDYELHDLQLTLARKGVPAAHARARLPNRVERIRKAAQRANLDPIAPTATDMPRLGLRVREIQASDAIPGPPPPRSSR